MPAPLARLARGLFGSGRTRWGLGLSQQMFTPYDTQRAPPDPADRPYAGDLAVTVSLTQATRAHQDRVSLALGEVEAGVVLFWRGWRLGYTEVLRSRTYHGQRGAPFNFGIVSAAVRF